MCHFFKKQVCLTNDSRHASNMSGFFSAMSSKYDRNRNRLKIGPIFMNLDDICNIESMTK